MTSAFMVNIAGPTYYRKAYEKVKDNSNLLLIKDKTNTHDKYAIKVCLPNGQQVGWVAASPHTLKPGCMNSKQANKLMGDADTMKAVVVSKHGQTTRLMVNGSNKDFIKFLKNNPSLRRMKDETSYSV